MEGAFNMRVGGVDGEGVYVVLREAPAISYIFIHSHDTSARSTREKYSFRPANLLLLAVHFLVCKCHIVL